MVYTALSRPSQHTLPSHSHSFFCSYCEEEERYPLVYGASRKRRSAYCEFEYFFREDIATALNVTTSRVLVLLMKAASRDHSLVYFRILPPATVRTEYFMISHCRDASFVSLRQCMLVN